MARGRDAGRSILFYVLVYTVWLKRRTAQNIVIGGAAGAFPPLIGWVAATGDVAPLPLLLFAIIFLWTPPHFWALSLFVRSDYAAAGVPMLPVVAGRRTPAADLPLQPADGRRRGRALAARADRAGSTASRRGLSFVFVVLAARCSPTARPSRPAWAREAAVRLFGLLSVRAVRGAGRRPVAAGDAPRKRSSAAPARAGADHGLAARRVRRPAVLHHHRQDGAQLVTALAQRNNAAPR
jgi:hypothetical protein